MVQYQSIPAVIHHVNAEPEDDMVKNNKSKVRQIAGAVLILFLGNSRSPPCDDHHGYGWA